LVLLVVALAPDGQLPTMHLHLYITGTHALYRQPDDPSVVHLFHLSRNELASGAAPPSMNQLIEQAVDLIEHGGQGHPDFTVTTVHAASQ
jgi:hypothetical protein